MVVLIVEREDKLRGMLRRGAHLADEGNRGEDGDNHVHDADLSG
jgi:hypothetical protein